MKLTKQLKAEIADVYEAFWGALFYADIDMYSLFLDEDYRLIGTTEQEFFFSKAEAVRFLKATADQLAGNLERRNSRHKIEVIENLVFITDQFDAYVLIDDTWSFYEKTRVTTLIQKKKTEWKIIQQHFSFPDNKAGSGQTIGLEKITKENLQLKEAIRRRTIELELKNKELEIEFSLERVRAVAMGMKQPADMLEVCEVIARELISLGVGPIRNIQTVVIDIEKETYQNYEYYQVAREKLVTTVAYKEHPTIHAFVKRMVKDPEGFYARRMIGEGLKKWLKYQAKAGQFVDPTSKKAVSLHYYFYSIGSGALGITTYAPLSKEAIGLFKRFRNVFQLAYARFVDIQQAEEQAREAQVQLAMERVRARTMAMQSSEELPVAANLLFQQVQSLGMPAWSAGYCIWDDNKQGVTLWMSSEGVMQPAFHAPLTKDPSFIHMREAFEQGQDFHVEEVGGKALVTHYKYMRTLPVVGEVLDNIIAAGHPLPVFQIFHCVYFSHGFLLFITYEPVPEAHIIFKRFGTVFDQTYTRFLDLQKAEAQAREAQIEAALEKVRSRSLAIHKSDELKEVVTVLFEKLKELQIPVTAAGITLFIDGSKDLNIYVCGENEEGLVISNYLMPYFDHPICNDFHIARQKHLDFFVGNYSKDEKNSFYSYLLDHSVLKDLPNDIKEMIFQSPKYTISMATANHSMIVINDFEGKTLSHNQTDIIKRCAIVFEQAYIRFLDLKKAEAQTREAQIEVALERLRSRGMAMHKSDELLEAGEILFLEMQKLGIESLTAGYVLIDREEKNGLNYTPHPATKKIMPAPVIIPHNETIHMQQVVENWKLGKPFFIVEMDEEETLKHQTFIAERSTNFPLNAAQLIAISPSRVFLHNFYFEEGYLLIVGGARLSAEQTDIMLRFAKVFQQTYTRFLDLQKAEAQAKEAQIEAALEKVRSRTMAMQSSNELQETAAVLFQEFKKLGTDHMYQVTIGIYNEAAQLIDFRVTSWADNGAQENRSFQLDMNEPTLLLPAITAWRANKKSVVIDLTGEALEGWLNYRNRMSGITVRSQDTEGRRVISVAFFSKGHISISSPVPVSDETLRTLERFAAVFDGTYTRFLDLEKAEAQAREARIAAALERVRSRTLAMQRSEELVETAAVLFQQLIALGIEPNRLYISIINSEQGETEFWITDEEGRKVSTAFTANMQDNATFLKMYEGWKQQQKSLVIDMQGEELQNYFRHLTGLGVSFKGGLEQKRRIQEIAYFSKGFIGMASPEEQPAETLELLERFAAVFNLTFTRFNDLKMAEAHARQSELDLIAIKEAKLKAEEALSVLQATQKQLVQAEKMASLGELTAGIAHEIQNPLNFVNNFSEVSKELLDEMKDAIEKGDTEEAKDIMNDVIQNLEKINHHGKRADGIVKGMLQHSRSSSGVKEPTDINALADEYLRLAYHGLRAKDKSFNATLKTEFDDTIGNINVIPQDIGRVILNLITNAFYAVDEKKKRLPAGYDPEVIVTTRSQKSLSGDASVVISVKDNGNGVPQNVIDKIFQPFFTTKPTGQGTGLGLSLSYDIVKAHGGELRVHTKEGEGSEFIIVLPILEKKL